MATLPTARPAEASIFLRLIFRDSFESSFIRNLERSLQKHEGRGESFSAGIDHPGKVDLPDRFVIRAVKRIAKNHDCIAKNMKPKDERLLKTI
jgi:hypothetical protein